MNKRIYSLIWNRSRNQVVVASELASGKSVAAARGSAAGGPKLAVLAVAIALAMMIAPSAMAGEPATRVSQDGSLAAVRYDVLDLQF
ncbi:MAG: ESPR domain-containing protein, partial [Pseudomonadota bacterium]